MGTLVFIDDQDKEHVLIDGPDATWRMLETVGELLQHTDGQRDGTRSMNTRIARGMIFGARLLQHAARAGITAEALTPDDVKRRQEWRRRQEAAAASRGWDPTPPLMSSTSQVVPLHLHEPDF